MLSRLFAGSGIAALLLGVSASAAPQPASHPLTPRQMAQLVLERTQGGRFLSAQAHLGIQLLASGSTGISPPQQQPDSGQLRQAHAVANAQVQTQTAAALPLCCASNVRVNNPAEDSHGVDQTTESEPAIAVTAGGNNIVVAFNDSQLALPYTTAGLNFAGYSVSTDGGLTFTDKRALPNPASDYRAGNNLGDPSLATDSAGNVYYSTLSLDLADSAIGVSVGKSSNGGQSFSKPVWLSPMNEFGYMADKPRVASGPDPTVARYNVYVGWNDFFGDFNACPNGYMSGLAFSRSVDGGAHYSPVQHLDQFCNPASPGGPSNCTFDQYTGADPVVDKNSATLYLAAWHVHGDNPSCTSPPPPNSTTFEQRLFKSTDGGVTWSGPKKIADVNHVFFWGLLGPGKFVRTADFPDMVVSGNKLYVVWNDARCDQVSCLSHIVTATSSDSGQSFASPAGVTTGTMIELQPQISLDSAGLHVLYLQLGATTFNAVVSNSLNGGASWTAQRVSNAGSQGVFTLPQFDPMADPGYMGDYLANVSFNNHRYFAWGDNRNTLTDFMYPAGRKDPDVYFAKQ